MIRVENSMAGSPIPVSSSCGVSFTATGSASWGSAERPCLHWARVSSVVTCVSYLQTAEHVQEGTTQLLCHWGPEHLRIWVPQGVLAIISHRHSGDYPYVFISFDYVWFLWELLTTQFGLWRVHHELPLRSDLEQLASACPGYGHGLELWCAAETH